MYRAFFSVRSDKVFCPSSNFSMKIKIEARKQYETKVIIKMNLLLSISSSIGSSRPTAAAGNTPTMIN